ncbi:MAG: hypothetical protein ACTHK8_18765 [Ginsengibacter sp.]
MVLTDKKQALLEIIEDADEKLLGLMIALANEYNDEDYIYSKEELAFFEKRRAAFFDYDNKCFSVEEADEKISRKYKN